MNEIKDIPGLFLLENFITQLEEQNLIDFIDAQTDLWDTSLKRRTMHFGYKYNYHLNAKLTLTNPIPTQFLPIIHKISSSFPEHIPPEQPINQIIINEYLPGQGINSHIDSNSFGDVIFSLSLGSDILMNFKRISMVATLEKNILLKRCSLICLKDSSRYKWLHGIANRKSDILDNGEKLIRNRRVSLTFRHVKLTIS